MTPVTDAQKAAVCPPITPPEDLLYALSQFPAGYEPDWKAAYGEAYRKCQELQAQLAAAIEPQRLLAAAKELRDLTGLHVCIEVQATAYQTGTHSLEYKVYSHGAFSNSVCSIDAAIAEAKARAAKIADDKARDAAAELQAAQPETTTVPCEIIDHEVPPQS